MGEDKLYAKAYERKMGSEENLAGGGNIRPGVFVSVGASTPYGFSYSASRLPSIWRKATQIHLRSCNHGTRPLCTLVRDFESAMHCLLFLGTADSMNEFSSTFSLLFLAQIARIRISFPWQNSWRSWHKLGIELAITAE